MLRRLALFVVVLLLLVGGVVYWAADGAAELPEWYREAEAAGELEADMVGAARRARQGLVSRFGRELLDELTADDGTADESFSDRIKRRGKLLLEGLKQGREVRMTASDLEGLLLARLADDEAGREILAATRAVHAEIGDRDLELGAVIVPARLPRGRISDEMRSAIDRLGLLTGSREREVYVGLRAVPTALDDSLLLQPPMRLRVGELSFSSELAVKLIRQPPAALAAGIQLRLGRVEVSKVAVDGGELVLTLSPRL